MTSKMLNRWLTVAYLVCLLAPLRGNGQLMAQPHATDNEFLARPYLQIGRNPSPQTMQVRWHTPDLAANWVVRFRTAPNAPWQRANPPAMNRVAVAGTEPHRVYDASLTGLVPGKSFEYQLDKADKTVFSATGMAIKTADRKSVV